MLKNQLRIIAGRWRGRKLKFPSIEGLRPTSDRLRETLFNWLRLKIEGAVCLDAFAGSGALGFEALSQGASKVIMLDAAPLVVKQLQENAAHLSAANLVICKIDTLKFLTNCNEVFDIIFIDPPFDSTLLSQALSIITERSLLKDQGVVYVEMNKNKVELASNNIWQVSKEKTMGQVTAQLLIRYRLLS